MRGTAVGVAEQPSCLGAIVRTWWRGEEGKPLKRAEENLFSYFNWSSLAAGWRVWVWRGWWLEDGSGAGAAVVKRHRLSALNISSQSWRLRVQDQSARFDFFWDLSLACRWPLSVLMWSSPCMPSLIPLCPDLMTRPFALDWIRQLYPLKVLSRKIKIKVLSSEVSGWLSQ